MFKNLREKILVSDSNSKNDSGEQSLSRFSSINSLVSDVGSVFSKVKMVPQHVQPSNRNAKYFQDNESVSEYDDSIVQGDVINKEELFQRYQRAQTLAKRYKLRSLEVIECYKKLEIENSKLTHTLTESQDCNIIRVAELREQIELDKKAKQDVEENYRLMIDENTELINVLRLQISLLKEGQDLPTELESQIKEKHDLEVQKQKKKDDEIYELRASMAQKDNLLQRCKSKITTLNSQLTELKAKISNTEDISLSGEVLNDQFSFDLNKQRFQHIAALENLQKEHSERIKIMLCDFEQKKIDFEREVQADFEQKCLKLKEDLNDLREQMCRISQDNERLQEQVHIKTKIIEELIESQDKITTERTDKSFTTIDKVDCYDEPSSILSVSISNEQANMEVIELRDENKFLLGRIDQMEALKLQTEEEISKIEEELKNVELKLKKEKEDCEVKCNSYELKLEEMKVELNLIVSKNEELSLDVININALLLKNKQEAESVCQDYNESKTHCQSLEKELKGTKDEMAEILLKLENTCKTKDYLDLQLQNVYKDYEFDKCKFQECEMKCKELKDKYDELNASLENEIHEKRKLMVLLNDNKKSVENHQVTEDALDLNMLEMRQRYDQELEEGRNQISGLELIIKEKLLNIVSLETKIDNLRGENETMREELNDSKSRMEELVHVNEVINSENKIYIGKIEKIEIENNTLIKDKEDYLKIIEENEKLTNSIKIENDSLQLKAESLTSELDKLREETSNIVVELDRCKIKIQERQSAYVTEKEDMQRQWSTKDEALQYLIDEKKNVLNLLSDTQKINDHITQENLKLKANNEDLEKELIEINENITLLEEYKIKYNSSKEESYLQLNALNKTLRSLENDIGYLKSKESNIFTIQQSLDDTEKKLNNLTDDKNLLERKMNIVIKCLKLFQQWNNKVVVSECGNDCSTNNLESFDFWNCDLKQDCDDIEELLSFGSSLQRVLSSWISVHKHFHMLTDELNNLKSEKILNNNFMKGVKELCFYIESENDGLSEDEILSRLSEIHVDKSNLGKQLSLIENRCKIIEEMLTNENFTDDGKWDETSILTSIKKLILDRITYFRAELQNNNDHITKLKNEKEIILKKYDKMLNDKIQHFRLLTNIFELNNIDFEHKSFSKIVIKGLKDYAQKHADISKELNETLSNIEQVERELSLSREECNLKQSELNSLKETVEEDRSRLFTMREELDRSLEKLNEFSYEKGRIDEEKQSMKKELNELNEKIQYLKLDFEKQISDKQKLEKQFDESLEKVKVNHLALEETYKKEIEKQRGYQHYLEEQITVNKEEITRKLTEKEHVSNTKLEEVLKQSEQLLVLNHQYKELLDQSKTESNTFLENLKRLEAKCESLQCDVDKYKSENEKLSMTLKELKDINELVTLERDGFKMELDSFIKEKQKLLESLNKSCEEEKFTFLEHIKSLEIKNNEFGKELYVIKEAYTKVENECDDLRLQKTRLLNQLEDDKNGSNVLKSNIEKKIKVIKDYENEMYTMEMKMKDMKDDYEREIYELKQQFNEEKYSINDDHNHRVKKLAKDFNEKILEKEHEFQKTFQEVLENIRKDEARQKVNLKNEIDQLNLMVIDLETEKNSLMNTISDLENDVKKANLCLQNKHVEVRTLEDEILGYKSEIGALELNLSKSKDLTEDVDQRSKINQTVETHSYLEDSIVDTVNANDHDVLQMHCADVEEQVRQLHLENVRLKQTIVENQVSSSMSPSREHTIATSRSHQLTSQPSFENVSLKSSNILNAGYLRSPNTSCSEYQFCPYPITEATEYEYLHDILVKYMTGLETNTLARVLCTVMKFSKEETRRILGFEQEKKKVLQIFPRLL